MDTTKPASERYRIVGRIAVGGMAEIYLARMLSASGAEREVVLKRLMPELQTDQEFVQMFYDEARIASQMRHPSIVQIYELGELDGSLFIAMELIRGVNLRDLYARLTERGERLPTAHAVRIACGALEALSYAHQFTDASGRTLNVVHRDVSPQNIVLTFEGTVKLVDFGVAKAEGRLHQTRAGLIKGKFAYMSPEQIGGGQVDGRSDLFALAEVLYELLLGRHPFQATSDMEVLRSILDVDPPHPSEVDPNFPSELGSILIRALSKSAGNRFSSAATMHEALESFMLSLRTPVTASVLERFITNLFADRIALEQRAREAADDQLLIEALMAGRLSGPSRSLLSAPSRPAPRSRPASFEAAPPPRGARRDRVIEISRAPSSVSGPAEPAAPEFMAYSGFTNPKLRRRQYQSQLDQLFDETPMFSSVIGGAIGADDERPTDVEGEIGDFADYAEQLTIRGLGLQEIIDAQAAELASASVIATPPDSSAHPPAPRRSDGEAEGPRPQRARGKGRRERLGFYLFVCGLGTLVGAVVYAFWLYRNAQTAVIRVDVSSTPPGASILFDGAETAARTPSTFQNIAANREHTLELRLEGYETHTQTLPPASSTGEVKVDWSFRPLE